MRNSFVFWSKIIFPAVLLAGCGTPPEFYRLKNLEQIARREAYGKPTVSSGYGKLSAFNGEYEGNLQNNLFHGKGTFSWTTGHAYEGEYVRGRMQGHGTFRWPDGSRYVGTFADGKRDGRGTIVWPDGRSFVATFSAGKLLGGEMMYPDRRRVQGNFSQANFDRSADIVSADKGTIIFPDNSRFEGEVVNGYPGLVGFYLEPNGLLRNGAGRCYDEEGVVACSFANGKRVDDPSLVRAEKIRTNDGYTGRSAGNTHYNPDNLRIREDGEGLYCCPFTSDGVLAEWVDMAIKSQGWKNIGGGVGMTAGALLGKEGAQLLKDVPYAGAVGAIAGAAIGKAVGEEIGRDTYLDLVGGVENVRKTSDISTDSLEDLAIYLYRNHSEHPNYQDALQATFGIYPDLKPVYETVLTR